ncbi:thioredoxin family protein [Ilumatobacter sp.]|uniref:thioredoxin family protein n=1 Tax=Ilumatobacter sp. TaxID=1967498 RepID=UPI003AF6CA49
MTHQQARHEREHGDPVVRTGVLFFSTPGCASCRTVRSIIARLDDTGEVPIVEIDAAADAASAARHRVLAAPTLLAFHQGIEVARRTGPASAEVLGELRAAAAGGTALGRSTAPRGLVVLRLLAALVLLLVGVLTATPTLVVVGAVIVIWALAPLAHKVYEFRTR